MDYCFQTLLCHNGGGGHTATKYQHPCPILLQFRHYRHSSLPFWKNHKKTEVDKKIQACKTINIDHRLCTFLVQMLKIVSISFINFKLVRTLFSVGLLSNLLWKQYIIIAACLWIIHVIKKGVISPYVQE